MNLSLKHLKVPHMSKFNFQSPKHRSPVADFYKSHSPHKFFRSDSRKTLIDKERISDSFNSSILAMGLKQRSYKWAETELRGILNRKSLKSMRDVKVNKLNGLLSARLSKGNSVLRIGKTDSLLSPKEADLIWNEHRNVKNRGEWDSLLSNYKQNPKQLFDLIPISLSLKNKSFCNRSRRNNEVEFRKPLKATSINAIKPIFLPAKIVSVDMPKGRITDDWANSLLFYNVSHKIQQKSMFRLKKSDFKKFLKKLPESRKELKKTKEKCIESLKSILKEMLGTDEDFAKFEITYKSNKPSTIKVLIQNCLKILEIRKNTKKILEKIIERERIMKKVSTANREEIMKVHELSNEIRNQINIWLSNDYIPFKKFVYKGADYLIKISKDLVLLQSALYKQDH